MILFDSIFEDPQNAYSVPVKGVYFKFSGLPTHLHPALP